jgi:TRAP-type uncharacterized transport system substrate-binding protein
MPWLSLSPVRLRPRLRPVLTFWLTGAVGVAAAVSDASLANQINTGDIAGAYHLTFCPAVEGQLSRAKFDHKCTPSTGTLDNMKRVAADPRQLGYGQLDVFALEAPGLGGAQTFSRVRVDDVRECVFAVTRNREITNWGDITGNAAKLRFIVGPKDSGAAGTLKYLQKIDAEGIAKIRATVNASDPDEAIDLALSADDTVALLVQFPDPDNARFKKIHDSGGHIVPVIDRAILRQQLDGQKIYFAQETQVSNAKWLKAGQTVVTACTPLVLFSGTTDKVSGDKPRQDHKDMVATLQALKTDVLMPQQSLLTRVWKKTRELSGSSVEKLVVLSEQAREQAKPIMGKAIEATKPALDKAKELGEQAIGRAKDAAKGMTEPKQ